MFLAGKCGFFFVDNGVNVREMSTYEALEGLRDQLKYSPPKKKNDGRGYKRHEMFNNPASGGNNKNCMQFSKMSLNELGETIFGGPAVLIRFLRQHNLLAGNQTCSRLVQN